MSRTYNTRPMWVQNNDPRGKPTRVFHKHQVVLQEPIGTEEYEPYWARGETRTRTLYRRWAEPVSCTLDVLEQGPTSWRGRNRYNMTIGELREEKNCYTNLRHYPENWWSHKSYKRLTNQAIRSKVNQQLHEATKTYGIAWDEVDIYTDSKYDMYGWWD